MLKYAVFFNQTTYKTTRIQWKTAFQTGSKQTNRTMRRHVLTEHNNQQTPRGSLLNRLPTPTVSLNHT